MSFRQGIMLCGMGTRGNSGPGLASLSGPGPRFTWDHLAKQMEDLYITASSTRPCVQRRCTRKCLIKLAPIVVAGPYSGGQSHQRQPLFSTCTMPLMTRRSSTRSTPRTSVGRRGSIRFHCLSLSQNRVLRTIPIPLPKTNQNRIGRAEKLMSSDPSRQGNQWCEQLSWAEGKERNACGCLGRWIAGLLYRSRAGRAEG